MLAFVGHRRSLVAAGALGWLLLAAPATVSAHGRPTEELTVTTALTSWTVEPVALLALLVALLLYLVAVRRVDRAHPDHPVPRRRIAAWLAGLAVVAVALFSVVDVYADELFSVHMIQHLLLTMVAPPLLLLGAPLTLLLRSASHEHRQRWILPVLESRAVSILTNPLLGWITFALVMWGSHFSPLFDAALADDRIHALEHALFLSAGLLFWLPVVGVDPSPHRLSHAARVVYLLLGLPQNSFLGLAIFSASSVLYPHYAALVRAWGPTPLEDQQLAGGIMWAAGDLVFLIPLLGVVVAWFRSEEEKGRLNDERLDRERARLEATGRSEPARR
ncbi:MAG: cytochrome c oxidase assembly protein [Candidatus Limnocylindrales bacterium]